MMGRMEDITAEQAYSFRHALVQEAAYQLQLPSERARLHLIALQAIERGFGEKPPELPPIEDPDEAPAPPCAKRAELRV
jgi:predicted ATPase